MDESIQRRVAAGRAIVQARVGHLHAYFGRADTARKHDGTRVTPADLEISRAICAELASLFPEDQRFSEEAEPAGGAIRLQSRFSWILDPIDGTNNYYFGIPVCAISLALLEHGTPVYGFVYDLGARTLYHGGPGRGMWADDLPVVPAAPDPTDFKIIAVHSPVDAAHLPLVMRLLGAYKLRAFGSGSLHLAYVALGRVDAAIDLTVRVWDIAAAWAFCRETGREVRFFDRPVFPLQTFDLHMRPVRYLAGSPAACDELGGRLAEAGVRFAR